MSFSRTIRKLQHREAGKGLKVSLIESIHENVLKHPAFSKKRASVYLKQLIRLLEEDNVEEAAETFSDLYAQFLTIRPRAEHVFHPSTLSNDCARMLWFDLNKTPRSDKKLSVFKAQTYITFDQGSWFHLYAQQKLKDERVLTKAEIRVHNAEWKVDGRMDGEVLVPEAAGLEIKTMNSFQFNKAKATNKPFIEHMKQAGLYAYFLKLKKVVFLYFNKDTSEMLEFHWDIDMTIIQPMLDKMQKILKAKKPLERECPNKTCERALGCPFKTHCFNLKA
jgi:hypothetical protein